MNASKAKRRWMAWNRYVQKAGSKANGKWGTDIHQGQARAYQDVMFAGRAYPRGARVPYYPKWREKLK